MQRHDSHLHKIALLATGDEICTGDILNTNSREISSRLTQLGMNIRTHLSVRDITSEIETALHFLLKDHDAVIITGGLGPTSDDLTRYALANVLERKLVFDAETWDTICARLQRFGYTTPPESNRQQAMFPEGATLIPNANGTAAACSVQTESALIFMLPGPPNECLPIVDAVVIPTLIKHHFQEVLYRKKWLVFGVSEGKIAEELDLLAEPYQCTTGYRLWYPYIECKLFSNVETDFTILQNLIEKTLTPYLIADGSQSASERLRHAISTQQHHLIIDDPITGGLLETLLKTPETHPFLHFSTPHIAHDNATHITLKGLSAFWENRKDHPMTELSITFNSVDTLETSIPFRGQRVKVYAAEWICREILKKLGF